MSKKDKYGFVDVETFCDEESITGNKKRLIIELISYYQTERILPVWRETKKPEKLLIVAGI